MDFFHPHSFVHNRNPNNVHVRLRVKIRIHCQLLDKQSILQFLHRVPFYTHSLHISFSENIKSKFICRGYFECTEIWLHLIRSRLVQNANWAPKILHHYDSWITATNFLRRLWTYWFDFGKYFEGSSMVIPLFQCNYKRKMLFISLQILKTVFSYYLVCYHFDRFLLQNYFVYTTKTIAFISDVPNASFLITFSAWQKYIAKYLTTIFEQFTRCSIDMQIFWLLIK